MFIPPKLNNKKSIIRDLIDISKKRNFWERFYMGWGIRKKNGERRMKNLIKEECNALIKRQEPKYATFKSGGKESQIDFFLCKKVT